MSRRHYQESTLCRQRNQETIIESLDSQAQEDLRVIVQEQMPFERKQKWTNFLRNRPNLLVYAAWASSQIPYYG